jgi:hypothetical protein
MADAVGQPVPLLGQIENSKGASRLRVQLEEPPEAAVRVFHYSKIGGLPESWAGCIVPVSGLATRS